MGTNVVILAKMSVVQVGDWIVRSIVPSRMVILGAFRISGESNT